MTARANELLELLRGSEGHMTAEEMYVYAKSHGVTVSMASVYRILGQLADNGLVRRIPVPGSPDIFDKTVCDHAHTVCPSCGAFGDFPLPDIRPELERVAGGEIASYELCIRCLCPACRA
ncbi:MAG: transcriptional repressor [Clostridia bacterium]|nr:transcriptional repressor [Clostridia bacterium]